jgi:predicted SAM-dependent methyltransferase
MIIANHILEHIPDDHQAMKEIYRVLKPGGAAVLQVPYAESLKITFEDPAITDAKKRSFHFGQKDHVRIYSLNDYVQRLKRVGFAVNIISYVDMQDLYRYAIQQNECFLDIRKPLLLK